MKPKLGISTDSHCQGQEGVEEGRKRVATEQDLLSEALSFSSRWEYGSLGLATGRNTVGQGEQTRAAWTH